MKVELTRDELCVVQMALMLREAHLQQTAGIVEMPGEYFRTIGMEYKKTFQLREKILGEIRVHDKYGEVLSD